MDAAFVEIAEIVQVAGKMRRFADAPLVLEHVRRDVRERVAERRRNDCGDPGHRRALPRVGVRDWIEGEHSNQAAAGFSPRTNWIASLTRPSGNSSMPIEKRSTRCSSSCATLKPWRLAIPRIMVRCASLARLVISFGASPSLSSGLSASGLPFAPGGFAL